MTENKTCTTCNGKRYLISTRDDGRAAIERCDSCQEGSFTDEDAARLALTDGIQCSPAYPCVLLPLTVYAVVKLELTHRGDAWMVPGFGTPEEHIAGYLEGAFGNALLACDIRDKVIDLAVFGSNQAATDREALEDLLK